MGSFRRFSIATAVAAIVAGGFFVIWQKGQPPRAALQASSRLASNLVSTKGSELLDTVVIPVAIQDLTPAEQQHFLSKVLADELLSDGVLVLRGHAQFGSAKSIFPNECAGWCQQAGVNPDDCVAWRMERAGIQAEVLLVHAGEGYRIMRCNNVKQMAEAI
jgi:hypothetical protein